MQKLNFNINGKHYEATITEVEHNVAEVELNGKKYTIDVERAEAVSVPQSLLPSPLLLQLPLLRLPLHPRLLLVLTQSQLRFLVALYLSALRLVTQLRLVSSWQLSRL